MELERVTEAAKSIAKGLISSPLGRGGLALSVGFGGLAAMLDLDPQNAASQILSQNDFSIQNSEALTGDFKTVSRNGVTLTRISGEGNPDNGLSIGIIPQGFSSYAEAKERANNIVNYIYMVNPLSKYQNRITFWVSDPSTTANLGCNQVGETRWVCDDQAKINEIDRINSAGTGVFIQEVIVLQNILNNNQEGEHAGLDGDGPPSLYTSVVIAMPPNPEADWMKLVVAHGLGHSIFNFAEEYLAGDGNGRVGNTYFNCREAVSLWRGLPGDPGTKYEGCAGQLKGAYRSAEETIMRAYIPDFGPLNSWYIGEYFKLTPGNFMQPPFELHSYRTNPMPGKGFPNRLLKKSGSLWAAMRCFYQ